MNSGGHRQQDRQDHISRRVIGSLCLYGGVALLALSLIHATYQLTFMPHFWFRNRPLWVLAAFAFTGAGWMLLRDRKPEQTTWQPGKPGARFNQVTLYSRPECHLCDDALELLAKYRDYMPPIEEVNIDEDPQLQEQFRTSIPVVEIDGKIRFRGRVDETLLRRLIEATEPHT